MMAKAMAQAIAAKVTLHDSAAEPAEREKDPVRSPASLSRDQLERLLEL